MHQFKKFQIIEFAILRVHFKPRQYIVIWVEITLNMLEWDIELMFLLSYLASTALES
ncbi:hypothetical protein RirG_175920 [Rhizophagus irregularis DAOM 197198w]|uniref:Uncharacterized protein n=1 Tax=Rhizophagus irregularis (strain DAOM 197198w) TaxID=1432141 RepID=A0A015KMA8_RHIIW|nr:hypothetical protein RirG_175920 [Rhizophagus irregularis DAOM 197198w]